MVTSPDRRVLIRRRTRLSPQNRALLRGACLSTSRHTIQDCSPCRLGSVPHILGKRRRSRPKATSFSTRMHWPPLKQHAICKKVFIHSESLLNGSSSVCTAIATSHEVQNILSQEWLVQNWEVSLYTDKLFFIRKSATGHHDYLSQRCLLLKFNC